MISPHSPLCCLWRQNMQLCNGCASTQLRYCSQETRRTRFCLSSPRVQPCWTNATITPDANAEVATLGRQATLHDASAFGGCAGMLPDTPRCGAAQGLPEPFRLASRRWRRPGRCRRRSRRCASPRPRTATGGGASGRARFGAGAAQRGRRDAFCHYIIRRWGLCCKRIANTPSHRRSASACSCRGVLG